MTTIAAQHRGIQVLEGGAGPIRLQHDVFVLIQDGIGRVFDFERAHFFGIDAIGTQMLSEVIENGLEEAARRIAAEYRVPEQRVAADIVALINRLERQGLLVRGTPRRDIQGRARQFVGGLAGRLVTTGRTLCRLLPRHSALNCLPGRFTTCCLIKLAWLSLRLLGWRRSISLWCIHSLAASPTNTEPLIDAVDRAVRDAASAQVLFPSACKERALVGTYLLRRLGIEATLVIGVERHPFQAHAWVECNGQPITDDAAHCEMFTPLALYR